MRTNPVLLALLFAFAACSDAPRSVAAPQASSALQLPPGHPKLPPDHPPLSGAASSSAEFSGRARLRGPLADVETGFVFISVRPQGQKGPLLTYRVDLADPKLVPPILTSAPDGTRELHFVLNGRTSQMPGEVPEGIALELQLLYDPDGDIDSKDGRYETVAPVEVGASDLELDLPAAG